MDVSKHVSYFNHVAHGRPVTIIGAGATGSRVFEALVICHRLERAWNILSIYRRPRSWPLRWLVEHLAGYCGLE